MDLREYLFRNRMSQGEFAEKIGTTRRYVSAISTGYYRPGPRLAKDIEAATEGQVTVAEVRPEKPNKASMAMEVCNG